MWGWMKCTKWIEHTKIINSVGERIDCVFLVSVVLLSKHVFVGEIS